MDNHVLYSFDPSLACTGWAVWLGGRLLDCGYIKTAAKDPLDTRILAVAECNISDLVPDELALEWPEVYRGGSRKGANPNDLLPVSAVAGALVVEYGIGGNCTFYKPRQWKGNVGKDVMVNRVLNRLDEDELKVYTGKGMPKTYAHNAADAIGVGLKHLGRL